jgi:hypothetical protein
MTDPDDKLRRYYRELAREEPGAVLDAAILAASRRAVARPSAARRWGPPVSIAAVLMLAVGVSLNMQREQPGVEYREPARPSPAPAATPPEAPAQLPVDRAQSLERRDATPALRSQPAAPGARKREEKFALPSAKSKDEAPSASVAVEEKPAAKKDTALADSAPERPAPRPYFAPEPPAAAAPASPPAASLAAPAAPARATTNASVAAPLAKESAAAPAVAGRMKSEADSLAQGVRAQAPPLPPEQELERIARLRLEGRHADADKALEEFRRRHPDFRIPAAMWERIRPR